MTTESRLRVIRDELKISRERLAFLAGGNLCASTVRNAEIGSHRLTFRKAKCILQAVNIMLIERQKPTITLDDLGIDLY